MRKRFSRLLCLILCVSTTATQASRSERDRSEQALFLSLNEEGLAVMANELKEQHLQPIQNEALPDYNEEVSSGVKVHAQGLRYSVAFGNLRFKPQAGHLAAELDVKNVSLSVAKARFTKKIIFDISSTCKNTSVSVNGGTVSGKVVMKVINGNLDLSSSTLSFPVANQSYSVNGPEECSGFLIGGLIAGFVNSTLKKSKNVIEKQLNERLKDLVPKFQDKLNELVKRHVPIHVPKLYPLVNRDLILKTAPYAVELTTEGLACTLSVGVQGSRRLRGFEFGRTERGGEVGEAGTNPELLNEVLETLLKQMPEWREITEEDAPGLGEIVNVENFSAIWPDLKATALSNNALRLFVGFSAAPSFALDARGATMKMVLPLKVKLMVEQNHQWIDYFEMTVNVEVSTTLTIAGTQLLINLENDMVVTVGGAWASTYTPSDPMFEAETAEIIFASLLEYLYASGPVVKVKLPTFDIGGSTLMMDAPYVLKPFVRVKLLR